MDGVVWDYVEVFYMLVIGGIGGGKFYFLFILIYVFIQIGMVDVCDLKEVDLKDLESLYLFKNYVFYGIKWIMKCLKNVVEEMN